MSNPQKHSIAVSEKIQEAVGAALQEYTDIPTDKRQKLESQGMSLAAVIHEHVWPLVNLTTIKDLLIVMEEGIGNCVMLTPALRMLKHIHPLLKITVWCKEPAAQVIRGWKDINVITKFDNNYYDLCFLSVWSNQTAQEFQHIISRFCKQTIQTSLRMHHEAIQQMTIVEFLGGFGDLCAPHCQVAEGDDKLVLLSDYIVFGDTTLRNFGWDAKRWPHYQDLAKKIQKKHPDTRIFLIGDEQDKVEAKEKEWPDNVDLGWMGKLTIPQLAYLIKHAKYYLGNDTGPTHIAAAVGAKTYAIFAPTLLSKNKPLGNDVTIINKQFPCSPCQYTERFQTCECMGEISAEEVYNTIYHPKGINRKPKTILVGDFSAGAMRNEQSIRTVLQKKLGHKVIPFEYRVVLEKTKSPINTTYELVNLAMHHEPDHILICGGQQLVPEILAYLSALLPNTKVFNWYVDNRGQVEPWFHKLSAVCDSSFWSTGDPFLLSQVFSQTQKPCEFLPITPDDKTVFPIDVEKDLDVVFVGTPHSAPRVELLQYLVKEGINVSIFGNGDWPSELKPHVKKGVFGKEFNAVLNRAKIVLGTNVINTVPLYFSDRYFQPMAVQTVGLNQYVPTLEDMFENDKHMVFFTSHGACANEIKGLLADDARRKRIADAGYKLYKEKYTLEHILKQMFGVK